jgi:hypothetical protein
MKEQASAATTTTHPLFMAPFTSKELKLEIQKLLPDQSQCTSGITNRMLQAGDADFQGPILIFLNGPSEFHAQPSEWQISAKFCRTIFLKSHCVSKTKLDGALFVETKHLTAHCC